MIHIINADITAFIRHSAYNNRRSKI